MKFFSEDECLICGNKSEKVALLNLKGKDYDIDYYSCLSCSTIIPYPKTEYVHLDYNESEIKDYIELNGNIEILAGYIERLFPKKENKSFLDVGCGFGFLVDYVKTVYGWGAKGIEPSAFAEYGKRDLDVDIVNAPLVWNGFDEKYDVVFCAEVVEHVKDPIEFIKKLSSYLKQDGVLMITTPNALLVNEDESRDRIVEILSPKYHEFVMTPAMLEFHLQEFKHRKMIFHNNSTVICASHAPFEFNREPVDVSDRLNEYYSKKLPTLIPNTSAYMGIFYRYFRALLDQGKFEDARDVFGERTYNEGFSCDGPLAYYVAKYAQHYPEVNTFGYYMRKAKKLCEAKIFNFPEFSSVERSLLPLIDKELQ